ncbi:MAG: hypothetical protein KGK17_04810 [Betaproteobacteria bacterium]|nr:hypothetical protein [Betaproteobacteria bacterium]
MANDFYTHGGYPVQNANGASADARAEFDAIVAGFNKMPALVASALRIVRVNAGATALESVTPATAGIVMADGSVPMAANLPMGGNKITGLGAATVAGDAVRYEQGGTVAMVETHAAVSKATPVDADELPLADSAATFGLKKLTWANLKATLKTYFDTLYPVAPNIHAAPSKATPVDADEIGGTDSASSFSLIRITWANTKATLKTYFDTLYASLAGATFTGLVNFKTGANIASAATLNLSTAGGNTVHITGTTATSAVTMNNGEWVLCIADGAWPLTYHATNNKLNTGGTNYTCAVGDRVFYYYDGTTVYGEIVRQDGSINSTASLRLPSFTTTQASSALTTSMPAHVLDFRNATATTGTPATALCTPADLVVPATSNLGMLATTVSNRLAILEAYNSGAPVLCIANTAGGLQLDETNLISPTTIGASSNSNTVIYSAVACAANSPYRVIGFVDVVFTTGTGWSSPTLVQPAGGNALTAMGSIGYGQTQGVQTRISGITYYNPGKAFWLHVYVTSSTTTPSTTISINGGTATHMYMPACGGGGAVTAAGVFLVPANCSYVLTDANVTSRTTTEYR